MKVLANLRDTKEYTELEDLHKTGILPVKQSELSGVIRGKLNLYSHVREMLENSEKEAIMCIPAIELESRSRIFSGMFDRLKKAGVSVKVALSGQDSDIKKISDKFKIKAEKIEINSKFFISDRNQVLFVINNSTEEEEIGIWLNSELFSSALAYLFELAWKKK